MLIIKYGGPKVIEYGDISLTEINMSLVKRTGTSINPVNTVIRKGMLIYIVRRKLQALPGADMAG